MERTLEAARAIQPELIRIRRALHRWPEVAYQEEKTARFIAAELKKCNCDKVNEGVYGHGIVAEVRGERPGGVIALRADMDALPVQEETGLDFASENPGVMHACGHDVHVTGLLGAAKLLCDRREDLCGTVKLVFQPAEELPPMGGAKGMLDTGLLDDVGTFYGLHVWPDVPFGKVGVKAGPLMAAGDRFFITIRGKSAHGARPDLGVDALVLGAQFVTLAQTLVSRRLDPMDTAVLTFGQLHAGTAFNVIAGECTLEGTVRTFREEVRAAIETGLGDLLRGLCAQAGAEGTLNYQRGFPAVVNHPESAALAAGTAEALFGPEAVQRLEAPTMIAEDFAYYLEKAKGAFLWLGVGKEGTPPLHNCRFTPDEDILWRAAALLSQTALDALHQ